MIPRARELMFACSLIGVLVAAGCKDEVSSGDSLSDPSVQPRVIFTLPANGSEGPYELYSPGPSHNGMPHFVVRFNKLIRKSSLGATSVRASGFGRPVSVIPYPEYYYYRPDGAKTTHRGTDDAMRLYEDVLEFLIVDSADYPHAAAYDVGQTVAVTLDSTIEDINGNRLAPFAFSYKPEPVFRVTESIPENGATDFSPSENNLYLFFNTRCAPDIVSAMTLAPAMAGQWVLAPSDSTYVYFESNSMWPYNSAFSFTVAASARDRHGNVLGRSQTTSFTTRAFRVSSVYPLGTTVSPASQVNIRLSGPIDSGTVRTSFSISPPVSGTFTLYGVASFFTFSPTLGLSPNTVYTVGLSTTLRASNGEPLAAAYNYQFTTDAFRVTGAYPTGTNVGRGTAIYVYFNAHIDGSTAAGAFSMTPPVAGFVGYVEGSPGSGGYIDFFPQAFLDANATYTVTVGTSVKTKTGENLPQPYSFSFTTEN